MQSNGYCRPWAALGVLWILLLSGGCAQLPPNQNALSGKRMTVTITFNGPVNPLNYYFFLINNVSNQNAPGPIAVLGPPYGSNGFATSSDGSGTPGFTDYVEYNSSLPQGYGLGHVLGSGNNYSYQLKSSPISFTPPDPTNPNTANQLQFTLDMSQLIYDANGNPLTDQTQAITMARNIRWLQVNIVATNILPVDSTTLNASKEVDSLGNTLTSAGATSFLNLDMSQNVVTQNNQYVAGQPPYLYEPAGDVYPPGSNDPTLDITNWSISVTQQ
jgi:hypothetical protein